MSVTRRHPRGKPIGAVIDDVYAQLPTIDCKGLCQASCGSIGMSRPEQARIHARHRITLPLLTAFATPRNPLGRCPALTDDGLCGIYADRPFICRLWGLTEQMRCPHGCVPDGGFLPRAEAERLIRLIGT